MSNNAEAKRSAVVFFIHDRCVQTVGQVAADRRTNQIQLVVQQPFRADYAGAFGGFGPGGGRVNIVRFPPVAAGSESLNHFFKRIKVHRILPLF